MALQHHSGTAGSSSRTAPHILFGTPLRVFVSVGLIASMLLAILNAVSAQESTPAAPSSTPEATPSATMPRIELELHEVNESDMGGTVRLYEFVDNTIVEFEVTGAGGDHPAYIAGGTCETPDEPPLYQLNAVDNRGRSTTVIGASLDDLLADDHIVSVRMQADDVSTTIACATIEGEPSLGSAATPAASPASTPVATPAASPAADATGGNVTDGTGGPATTTTTPETTSADASSERAPQLTINLVDWSDTGVSGTATLTQLGNTTQVDISITGGGIVGGHQLHLHNGTCTTPGTATYTLNPVDANGNSRSVVNLSLDTLAQNSYFLNVHPDEANWDAWMVCGNITGTASVPSETPTTAVTTTSGGDGTGGGNTTMVSTDAQAAAFPQTVGVGDGLRWPSDTRTAVIWGLSASIIVMGAAAIALRMGERNGRSVRYSRMGF